MLAQALTAEGDNAEAFNAVRNLIQEIRVIPNGGNPQVELFGELPALLKLANKNPATVGDEVCVTMVAGARFSLRSLRVLGSVLRPRTGAITRLGAIAY
ncbi:MAG: hypothetical protein HWE34_03295 [Methylocystaceae bacterium]|nr:hypothetical protein [Methylocystaceae bacterium]